MIRSFRHRGLKRLYERDDVRGVAPALLVKVRTVLAHLDEAETIEDMDLPGWRLHALKGKRKDFWSVTVNKNWRITFRFEDRQAYDVEMVDYH